MPGILPRVVCEACGRPIAVLPSTGKPRPHRVGGEDCPGSGDVSGTCAVCGRVAPLELDGTLRPHKEIRVRRGPSKCPDGLLAVVPETYSSRTDCHGAGMLPEPPAGSGPDLSVERFPSPFELNHERWLS